MTEHAVPTAAQLRMTLKQVSPMSAWALSEINDCLLDPAWLARHGKLAEGNRTAIYEYEFVLDHPLLPGDLAHVTQTLIEAGYGTARVFNVSTPEGLRARVELCLALNT